MVFGSAGNKIRASLPEDRDYDSYDQLRRVSVPTQWRDSPGPIRVIAMCMLYDTTPKEEDWIYFPEKPIIATVIEDNLFQSTGGVGIYQKVLNKAITSDTANIDIYGMGFKSTDMKLTFYPPLIENVDYVLCYRDSKKLSLLLLNGDTKRWHPTYGILTITTMTVDNKVYKMPNNGVDITIVVPAPVSYPIRGLGSRKVSELNTARNLSAVCILKPRRQMNA
jgi:hypothetical protein